MFGYLPNGYYFCRVKLIIQKIMNKKEREEILYEIRKERADVKTKLSIFSYFLRVGANNEDEINELLDRLNELKYLEEKVKKM